MQSLVHLREATVQRVYLTATLVPGHERVLADHVGMSLERTLILRSPTARPNHRLQIYHVPDPKILFDAGAQLASLSLKAWEKDPDARGIIFVRSLKKLDEFAVSCSFPVRTFHGKMLDARKEEELKSWLSCENQAKWMVSTTALIHGVDYPRVDAVIFIESPFGLYDFVQGAGRAGRSDQESLVVVLHSGVPPPPSNESENGCRLEMERVITDAACRRLGISRVMDGKDLPCSKLDNALLCDFCQGCYHPLITEAIKQLPSASAQQRTDNANATATPPNPIATPPNPITTPSNPIATPPATPIQRNDSLPQAAPQPTPNPSASTILNGFTAQANATARLKHAESVKDLMDRFGGCFTCRIRLDGHVACHDSCGKSGFSGCSTKPHVVFTCTEFSHKIGWIDWKIRYLKWPADGGRCYFCGLPNIVAGSHKDSYYPGKCRYSDSALAAAWHVLHTPQLFEKIQRDMGFTPGANAEADFGTWVSQYGSEREDMRLLSVFSWLCRQYYPSS